VTRRADLQQLVAVERFGPLDVLVSNAGSARTDLVSDLDVDAWDEMIDINVRGVLDGIAAAMGISRECGPGRAGMRSREKPPGSAPN
jgi:NADP-dependent 3-hydroxy acid dehydrogenase YdfG